MPFADLPGRILFYAPAGDGPGAPAVLIHGAGGSHLDWPPALRRLPGRAVYALDLPGHGRSPGPAHVAISSSRDDLLAFLAALKLPPAVLIGHSLGAAVALEAALAAPAAVAGLVLIGAGPRLPVPPALLASVASAPERAIDLFVELAYGPGLPQPMREIGRARLGQVAPADLQADLVACSNFDVSQRLGEISAPAFIIAGGADRLAPAEGARRLLAELPDAEMLLLEGAGHLMTFERTAEVMAGVNGFLERRKL